MLETIEDYIKHLFFLPKMAIKEEWLRVFNEMAVHTRKRKPTDLLLKARPNAEPHITEYCLNNYEPVTYAPIMKAFDTINRLLTEINFNIVADQNVQDYIKELAFENYNFIGYHQKIVLKRDIEDPNGFLVCLPEGKGVDDSGEKVKPKNYLLYSDQLIYKDEKVYIFLSNEISYYKTQGSEEIQAGKVYWVLDKNEIWKVRQTGPDELKDFTGEIFYKHSMDAFPVIVLGGDMTADNFFESFFGTFNAMGNQCIRQFIDHQAIMVTSGFPIIEEFATECEVKTSVPRAKDSPESDSSEKYSQTVQLKSYQKNPFGITLRPIKADAANIDFEGTLPLDIPHRRYITPDINIAKYSGELWMQLRKMGEEDLAVGTTKIAQSGVAKEYDNETKYSMIGKICNNLFDNILLNDLKFIDCYLNKKKFVNSNVYINKPTTFSIKTEADLIDEISNLKKNGVPAMFVTQATIALSRKMFSESPVAQKINNVITSFDPLFIYSVAERSEMLMNGVISKEAYIRSVNMPVILLQMSQQTATEAFLKEPMDSIYNKFLEKVKPLIPVSTPLVGASGEPA